MKRFKFRLEAVEKVRKRKEEEALQALARARTELQSALDRKNSFEQSLSDSLSRRESLANQAVCSDAFAIEEAFISGTRVRIRQVEVQIHRAARVVERATRAYMHARRDTSVIETIKENDLHEFKKQQARTEMKEMDDLSSIRAARERVGT